jgi:hypothetical protein
MKVTITDYFQVIVPAIFGRDTCVKAKAFKAQQKGHKHGHSKHNDKDYYGWPTKQIRG